VWRSIAGGKIDPDQGSNQSRFPSRRSGRCPRSISSQGEWVEAFSESPIIQQPFKATGQGESDAEYIEASEACY